jgi:hypothetical protein
MRFIYLSIILIQLSYNLMSQSSTYFIIHPITGNRIQVAKKDYTTTEEDLFRGLMSYDDAISACRELGNGWRIPTIQELEQIHNKYGYYGIGNFTDGPYLSFNNTYVGSIYKGQIFKSISSYAWYQYLVSTFDNPLSKIMVPYPCARLRPVKTID